MEKRPHHPPQLSSPLALDYGVLSQDLARAQYALGLLEGLQRKLQNPSLLIAPLSAKEAAVSSKIEGTQSSVSDVFLYEAGGEPRHADTREVVNYRQAMNFATHELKRGRHFSLHLMKSVHQILLSNVRHRGTPGEFRRQQVWLGKAGEPIEKAQYVPPEALHVPEYMENLLSYVEKSADLIIVQAGILHYQFEAIHPFDDGNGRIGRLLVPLLLFHQKHLSRPFLYLSGYLERHRDEYIEALHIVDESGRYEPWLGFFFRAVIEQSKETQQLIEAVYRLYDDLRTQFLAVRSPYLVPLLDFLFRRPVFTFPMAMSELRASRLTCVRLVRQLQNANVVDELANRHKRAKLFAFVPLLKILR